MTDNEIIKALECCSTVTCFTNKCPYEEIYDIPKCTTKLTQDALDLINRQKAEIERSERSAKQWEETARELFISRENAKAEAIREFAKTLKEHYSDFIGDCYYEENFRNYVDNLVKEMVGAENG